MKLLVNRSPKAKTLPIPSAVLFLSGLELRDCVEFHAKPEVAVALPAQMDAMQMVRAIDALLDLSTTLAAKLALSCGTCEDCGLCECIGLESQEPVILPEHVLEEAGLPPGCKLTACVDEEGNILVEPTGYQYDLNDIPEHILDSLVEAGVCLADLEDRLMLGDIVYDARKEKEEKQCAESLLQ